MHALNDLLLPAAASAQARFPGLYDGVVTDVDDPLKVGRVKVRVPSIFTEQDTWARPCFTYGHFFVPDLGDHVWVAFEGGDASAPIWLGVWYPSGAAPAPASDAAPPVQRVVQTAGGQLLVLDDSDGKQRIRLQDTTGNYIELSTEAVTIHAEKPVTIDAPGQAITVHAASFDVQG
jgi:phage gp45-like